MTRVFLVISVFYLVQGAMDHISKDPLAYSAALSLIENYSPIESNLTQIRFILESLVAKNHHDSLSKLGEFWMLGFPISPENQHTDPELISSSKFKRNLDKAVYNFKKTLSSSPDSSHFLSLLMQQSLLTSAFDKYVPREGVTKATFQSLEDLSVSKQSSLGILSAIMHYELCQSPPRFPSFILEETMPYVELPYYYYPKCRFSCEEIAHLALFPATKALQYVQRNKRESLVVNILGQGDMFVGDNAKNMLKLFEKRVNEDHESLSEIGLYYMKGSPMLGIDPDFSAGLEILEKAASKGAVNAHKNLGILYSQGLGVEKNFTKAIYHLKYAMDNGSVSGKALLGEIYLNGEGVKKNEELGLAYLNAAAQQGNIESMIVLGKHHFLKKDWLEALKYFQVGSTNGDLQSIYYLGVMSLQGLGVQKNCAVALELFKQISFKGEAGTYAERAYSMYLLGDLEGAYLNYVVSASLGVENSLLSLAYLYENDLVPQPYKCKRPKEYCAAVYYSLAYRSPLAIHNIGKILNARGNQTEAYYYFTETKYLPESLFELARYSEYGVLGGKNIAAARDYYQEIINKSESNQFDKLAKYPAKLALLRLELMNNPYVVEFINQINSATQKILDLYDKILKIIL